MPENRNRALAHGNSSVRARAAAPPSSAHVPASAGGWPLAGASDRPEELAVCDLCGLVSRRPVPPVCPACGGGYG